MSKHTPGRVKVQHPDAGERGWEVAFEPGLERLCADITEANARRLVACWNALQDFSTEALEHRSHLLKAVDDQVAIIAQRQAAEKAKQEAQRERIRAEEAARLEREAAQAKARAEAEAQRERARIIAQAEAEARAAAAAERARIDAEIAQAEAQRARERIATQAAEAAAALARAEAAYTPPKAPPAPVVAAPTTPGPADDGERLTLGAINARLAPISVTVAGLSQLGVEPVATDKAARLYRACDFPAICRAISEHALALAEQPAAQEPVAWMCSNKELMHKGYQMFSATGGGDWNIPVYTAPQPRRRLTDNEIAIIYLDTAEETSGGGLRRMKAFARAIELAHGIGEKT